MIVVENSKKIRNFLETLDHHIGFVHLDLVGFELAQISFGEIFLIDSDILTEASIALVEKIRRCPFVLVYGEEHDSMLETFQNLFMFVNSNTSKKLFNRQVDSIQKLINQQEILKSQLLSMNAELNSLMGVVEKQVQNVRKLYHESNSKRFDRIGCVDIYAKYFAGKSAGCDVYDYIRRDNLLVVLLSSSSSYSASSIITTCFQGLLLKKELTESELKLFIEEVKSEIDQINIQRKKKVKTNIAIFTLDIESLEVSGHQLGNFGVIASDEEFSTESLSGIKMTKLKMNLRANNRYVFLSSGFLKTARDSVSSNEIQTLVSNPKNKSIDILDELFFRLKQDSVDDFLEFDSSAILIEVHNE